MTGAVGEDLVAPRHRHHLVDKGVIVRVVAHLHGFEDRLVEHLEGFIRLGRYAHFAPPILFWAGVVLRAGADDD